MWNVGRCCVHRARSAYVPSSVAATPREINDAASHERGSVELIQGVARFKRRVDGVKDVARSARYTT